LPSSVTAAGLYRNGNTTPVSGVTGANLLGQALTWLASNAESGASYTILLDANESIAPQTLSPSALHGASPLWITLRGSGAERTVTLASNGNLFTVHEGVQFILDDRITLNGKTGNSGSLIFVNEAGVLIMKAGAKITGNVNASADTSASGGGVSLWRGYFTMEGGEITGNSIASASATHAEGGGVAVGESTFIMKGGKIGNNTVSGPSYMAGGGVYIWDGVFTMEGGEIVNNSAKNGGGVQISGTSSFTMKAAGKIAGNTATDGGGGGVAVYGPGAVFRMEGGEIAGNTAESATDAFGGGVAVGYSNVLNVLIKTGGVIYGSNAGTPADKNVVKINGTEQLDKGAAVAAEVTGAGQVRLENTVDAAHTLNTSIPGASGGWWD
jgi:hypothetical protein